MLRVGLCGTDAEINQGLFGKPPDGDEFLILGHENFGIVEDVGKKVKGFEAGRSRRLDRAAPVRPVPQCIARRERHVQQRRYTERGIMRRHGFMARVLRRVAAVAEQDSEGAARHRRPARADVDCGEGHRSRVPAAATAGVEARRRRWCSAPGRWACSRRRSCAPAACDTRLRPRDGDRLRARRSPCRLGRRLRVVADKTLPTCEESDCRRHPRSRRPARRRSRSTPWRFSALNGVLCLLSVTGRFDMTSRSRSI